MDTTYRKTPWLTIKYKVHKTDSQTWRRFDDGLEMLIGS